VQKYDAIGLDHRVEGEGSAGFALTPAAMTAVDEHRSAGHPIAHGTAGAAPFENPITVRRHRNRSSSR
jgi:hypothetical protein